MPAASFPTCWHEKIRQRSVGAWNTTRGNAAGPASGHQGRSLKSAVHASIAASVVPFVVSLTVAVSVCRARSNSDLEFFLQLASSFEITLVQLPFIQSPTMVKPAAQFLRILFVAADARHDTEWVEASRKEPVFQDGTHVFEPVSSDCSDINFSDMPNICFIERSSVFLMECALSEKFFSMSTADSNVTDMTIHHKIECFSSISVTFIEDCFCLFRT